MYQLATVTNYDSYVRQAFAAPILSYEEEQEYGKLSDLGNLEATHALIVSHLRLVIATASKYLSWGLPKEDLVSEGTIGLMTAVKNFDFSNGARLAGFAIFHIKSAIQEYVRDNYDIVRVATTKAKKKIFNNFGYIQDKLKLSSYSEVATEYNVPISDIIEMEKRLMGSTLTIDLEEGEYSEVVERLTDGVTTLDILQMRDEELKIYSIKEAIDLLSPRERDIIMDRYLTETPETLEVLSMRHGISKERVRQIEVAAIGKLKNLVKESYFGM